MNKRFQIGLVCIALLSACGGGGDSTQVTTSITGVTVTSNLAAVATTQSISLTAAVTGTGAFSSAVTWTASTGTLSNPSGSSIVLTAPSAAGTVQVTATSNQDATKLGTINIALQAPTQSNTGTLTPAGNAIAVGAGNSALIQVEADAVTAPISASVKTYAVPPVPYPTGVTVIAPQTVVSFSSSGLNVSSDKKIFIAAPSNATSSTSAQEFAEVRIDLGNGQVHAYLDYYDPVDENVIAVSTQQLNTIFAGKLPNQINISVQPVDPTIYNSAQSQSNVKPQANANNKPVQPQFFGGKAKPSVTSNLFEFESTFTNGDATGLINNCDAETQTLPLHVRTIDLNDANSSVNFLNGKTPLILIHGWQVLGATLSTVTSTIPGVCEWQGVIKEFTNPNNTALRNSYALYSLSYDSYFGIEINSSRLAAAISKFPSGVQPVLLAHSMGGMVANRYLKDNPSNSVKHLITLSTPFRGTTAFLCAEADASGCKNARVNREVLNSLRNTNSATNAFTSVYNFKKPIENDANELLNVVEKYQGTRDLAWEYGNLPLNRFFLCDSGICSIGKSVANPKLQVSNANLSSVQLSKYTAYFGTTDANDSDIAYKYLAPAILNGSGHANDGIVPAASACLSSSSPDNTCSNSPLSKVVFKANTNHNKIAESLGGSNDPNSVLSMLLNLSTSVSTAPIIKISTSGYHSLVLKSDGTLWAFGNNAEGELGDGTTTNRLTPVKVLNGVSDISTGHFHSLALKFDGTLWGFGYNGINELGDGTTINRLTPVQILSSVSKISANGDHSLALKLDGTLWGFGYNGGGQLGNGTTTTTDRPRPVLILGKVSNMSAGYGHSIALKSDGTFWGFGRNDFGQVGDGTTINRLTPVQILDGFSNVRAGYLHTLALKSDETLWGFGDNSSGELGDGTTTKRLAPVLILSSVSKISAGPGYSLALKSDETLWGFGWNQYGQLGDGTTISRLTPVQILTGVSEISAGYFHSLALKTDGTLWAFGANGSGQLGDGTTIDRLIPTKVIFP